MRGSALLLALAFTTAALVYSSAPAAASGISLSICNRSESEINVAAGYRSTGPDDYGNQLTGPFVSLGWWVLEPGGCASIANPFSARHMYWTGYISHERTFLDGGRILFLRSEHVGNSAEIHVRNSKRIAIRLHEFHTVWFRRRKPVASRAPSRS